MACKRQVPSSFQMTFSWYTFAIFISIQKLDMNYSNWVPNSQQQYYITSSGTAPQLIQCTFMEPSVTTHSTQQGRATSGPRAKVARCAVRYNVHERRSKQTYFPAFTLLICRYYYYSDSSSSTSFISSLSLLCSLFFFSLICCFCTILFHLLLIYKFLNLRVIFRFFCTFFLLYFLPSLTLFSFVYSVSSFRFLAPLFLLCWFISSHLIYVILLCIFILLLFIIIFHSLLFFLSSSISLHISHFSPPYCPSFSHFALCQLCYRLILAFELKVKF
jgi:hypothetical protein